MILPTLQSACWSIIYISLKKNLNIKIFTDIELKIIYY